MTLFCHAPIILPSDAVFVPNFISDVAFTRFRDKKVISLGFGAKLPPDNKPAHDFPLVTPHPLYDLVVCIQ